MFTTAIASALANIYTVQDRLSKGKSDADLQPERHVESTPFPVADVWFDNVADGLKYCARKNIYSSFKTGTGCVYAKDVTCVYALVTTEIFFQLSQQITSYKLRRTQAQTFM